MNGIARFSVGAGLNAERALLQRVCDGLFDCQLLLWRPTGQALFRCVETLDGAPLIGRSGRLKAIIAAGLGDTAAFVAPAVARVLADAATEDDAAYFTAREVSKAAHRQSVAERDQPTAEAAA